MPKPTFKQTDSSKCSSSEELTRRSIHQHLHEDKKEFGDGLKNSPSKTKVLYPELQKRSLTQKETEDEKDSSDECEKEDKVKFEQKISSAPYIKNGLILFIIASTFIFVYLHFLPVTGKPLTELSLKEKLSKVENRFKNQNHLSFRILGKALEKVVDVDGEPSAPAIFTVTVNKNAIHKSHEFLDYLASALAPKNTVLINETVSWHNKPDEIKFKIDNEILSKAEEEKLFVVIVDNLRNIPLEGAMIFHSYCDHELAPFKQAVFFFIVPLNTILPENTPAKTIDKNAFQEFKSIWNKATPDKIDSLITRITVNVINIR